MSSRPRTRAWARPAVDDVSLSLLTKAKLQVLGLWGCSQHAIPEAPHLNRASCVPLKMAFVVDHSRIFGVIDRHGYLRIATQ